jgi:hypothetical protein
MATISLMAVLMTGLLSDSTVAKPNSLGLLKVFREMPDKTLQLLARYPSMGMGLTGASDRRIDLVAQDTDGPFKVRFEQEDPAQPAWILVDPTRTTGVLWWRRSLRVVLRPDELSAAQTGVGSLSSPVAEFLKTVADRTSP